jgi:GDP-4-dehydro-6-deoxy-D-mannose reductase
LSPEGPVLVTGAGGFVGGWMVRHFLAQGREVVAGVHAIRHDIDFPCSVEVFDLDDPSSIYTLMDRLRPTSVVHLAGMASPHIANTRPEAAHRVNFLGTLRLLEACKSVGIKPSFLIAGSATVYGQVESSELPLSENQGVRPADHYSLSKAAQESLAPLYQGLFPVVVARPFNHTGPGQVRDFALPAFASQIARIEAGHQDPVIRVGDLSAERDYLHVADVVDAYGLLLRRRESGVFNVCSGGAHPMSWWLGKLVERARVAVRIELDPSRVFPQGNPRLAGDNSRLRALGWVPTRQPEEIVDDLLEYWRQRIPAEME